MRPSCKHMQGFLICRCVFRRHVRASLEWMSHHFPQILSESPSRSIGHRSPQQQCLRPRWSDHAHVIGPKDFLFRIGTTAIRNRSAHFQSIGPGERCAHQLYAKYTIAQPANINLKLIYAGQGYPQGITCTRALQPAGQLWQCAKHCDPSQWPQITHPTNEATQCIHYR